MDRNDLHRAADILGAWGDKPRITVPEGPLHVQAHLGSHTQSPMNPLDVTYNYSVSAERDSTPTTLPKGVLIFYSDGLLMCSMNVGPETDGEAEGGECHVEYTTYGIHPVVVMYVSIVTVTTGIELEQIES